MRKAALLAAALCVLLPAAPAWAQPVVPASAPGTVECTTGPSFSLIAKDGRILAPDGASIYMWGYALDDADDTFQISGPTLCVSQGTTVTITLTNNLPALNTPAEPGADAGPPNTSLVFPGQAGVTSSGGTGSGLLANEASPGGTVTYSFVASRPGTYLYESGTEPSRQVEMGLYGAIIVRPALGANYAYNDPATEFDPEREYLLLLHDIDSDLHRAVDRGQPYDVTTKHDRYWTVTGRSFPDSIADSFVPWLPNQPYGSLVWVEMDTALPALIRYANAGLSNHPFHPHGNHLRVIARDGALLEGPSGQDASMEAFSKTIGSGQTYDLLFRFDDDESYSPGNPVQFDSTDVVFPGLLNTFFKDDLSFYSGSPYLGTEDDLPAAVTRLNECGEFYFPWHSHALNEFQNFDEGFGGLATLLRVDPTDGCPEAEPESPFATSPPVVSGLTIEQQTLTATDGTWLGTPPLTLTRQWQRLIGVVWTTIPGAAASMYTVSGDDVGMRLRICVTATNTVGSATVCSAPTAPVLATLRLSFMAPGTISGVSFADEDIVSFNGTGFSLLFDGSDVLGAGAALADVDAFHFIDADSILLSFDEALTGANAIPGFGGLDDSDAARFDATSLGTATAGTFSRFFDGSDVGLTGTGENIDSIQHLPGPGLGTVIVSTSGDPGLPGLVDETDEDIFRLTPTSLGEVTAGTWSYYFEGSDVGLGTAASEDVDSAWVAGNGAIYLSTRGAFSVPGLSGDDDDVFVFTPSSLGTTTAGTFSSTLQFNAGAFGQAANNVDAVGRRTAPVVSASVAPARRAAPKVTATATLRSRTLTVTARATRCSPCNVQAKVKAPGRKQQTLAMRRVGRKYVAVAPNLPRGRTAYYVVARDVDSRRSGASTVRQAQIGAAALVTFDLCADEGSVTLPAAGPVPIWGFSQNTGTGCGPAQLPGPQLVVNEGDVVTLNLTNNLDTASTSLVFPGHTLAPDTVGTPPGGTASYTFTATSPGVYLYETGVDTQIQLPMGLYGALVVRPALGPSFAYNDLTSQFDVEAVMVLSEVDTDLNASPGTFDPLDWDPNYWLINGLAHPDVPDIAASPGSRIALRYLDAGQEHHTITLLGLRQRIIGRDSFQPVARPDIMAETIAVGSTADAIAVVPAGSSGSRFPLYSRQLAVTNGPVYPGGMLAFIAVP